MDVFTALEYYKNFKKIQGLRNISIEGQCQILEVFFRDSEIEEIEEITQAKIDKYILLCKNRNLKNTSINNYLSAIKIFLKWGYENEYIEKYPKIKLLKTTQKQKIPLSEEELKILLKKPNQKKCSYMEFLMWTISNILLATGIRCATLTEMKIKDVNISGKYIFCTHLKTAESAILPIPDSLISVIEEYLKIRKGNKEDFLIVNKFGEKYDGREVGMNIKNYAKKRGITSRNITPHLFRHTFACEYLKNGGNMFFLKDLLTHKNIKTTQVYVKPNLTDLQHNFNELNPLTNALIKTNINKPKKEVKIKMH